MRGVTYYNVLLAEAKDRIPPLKTSNPSYGRISAKNRHMNMKQMPFSLAIRTARVALVVCALIMTRVDYDTKCI